MIYILNIDYVIDDINEWIGIMLEEGYSDAEIREECVISRDKLIQIKKEYGIFPKKKKVKHLKNISELEEENNRLSIYKERNYSELINQYEIYHVILKSRIDLLEDTQSKILDEMESIQLKLRKEYRLLDSFLGVKPK